MPDSPSILMHAPKKWKPLQLPDEEEKRFRNEFKQTPFYQEFVSKWGEQPDISMESDFDYRRWWKDGFRGMKRNPVDGLIHGPSRDSKGNWLKAPFHPTKWKQEYIERYGVNPDEIGATSLEDRP